MLYFDHNATTFVAPEVAETMAAAIRQVFGNASSTHREGQLARQHLERSRSTIAAALRCSPAELAFTSGGTESNNMAILGTVRNAESRHERKHILVSTIEHPAVLEPCRQLAREGHAVEWVSPDENGFVDPASLISQIRDETVLVSLMHANNEVGALQAVSAVGQAIAARRSAGQTIYLHSDGVQVFGRMPVDINALNVDLYSISAHKLFGPKGIGALYARKGVRLQPVLFGGRHERERRPGTENVPAAMGFARAVELSVEFFHTTPNPVAILRNSFEDELRTCALNWNVELRFNAKGVDRLPGTSNVEFGGLSAEALTIALDLKGACVSTGSACSSGSVEPSHVLLAMGRTREQARSSIRFSFGRYNTDADVERLLELLHHAVEAMRAPGRKAQHVVV